MLFSVCARFAYEVNNYSSAVPAFEYGPNFNTRDLIWHMHKNARYLNIADFRVVDYDFDPYVSDWQFFDIKARKVSVNCVYSHDGISANDIKTLAKTIASDISDNLGITSKLKRRYKFGAFAIKIAPQLTQSDMTAIKRALKASLDVPNVVFNN